MRRQGAAPGGSASLQAWLRDIPAHCHGQGSRSSPTLPPQYSKNLVPLNPSSAQSSTAQPHGTSTENTASPPLQPGENSSRSTFPAGEGREQPDAVLEPMESLWEWGEWGRDRGWRQGCTMVWLHTVLLQPCCVRLEDIPGTGNRIQ